MTFNDLQQLLDSSPLNTSNDSSPPDMTEINEMSDGTWDDTLLHSGDCMNSDALVENPTQASLGEYGSDPFSGLDFLGLPDDVDIMKEMAESELLAPTSIFGVPSGSAPQGTSNYDFTSGPPGSENVGFSSESLAHDSFSGAFEQSIADYIPRSIDHGDPTLDFNKDENDDIAPRLNGDDDGEQDVDRQNVDEDGDEDMAENEEDACDDFDPTPQDIDDDDLETIKWDLRPQAGVKRGFTSTWRDQDESGDFDPDEERRLKAAKRARRTAASRRRVEAGNEGTSEGVTDESEEAVTEAASDEQSSIPTESLVKLVFTSDECIEAFGDVVSIHAARRSTQRRSRTVQKQSQTGRLKQVNLGTDFKNKPSARCCWSCVDIHGEDAAVIVDGKAECSLATDPTHWPCTACREVGEPCALVTEPIRKMACEDCKRQRIACSFNSTRNHSGSCQQCQRAGHRCISGPAKDAIVPRLGYKPVFDGEVPALNDEHEPTYTCDAPVSKNRDKKRRPLPCVECSEKGLPCSYGEHWGACDDCKRTDQACTIPDKVSLSSIRPRLGEPLEHDGRTPFGTGNDSFGAGGTSFGATLPPERVPSCDGGCSVGGPQGTERTIITSFSHPISFNCDDEKPYKECHLCAHPALRIVGFGKKRASVIDFDDSSGFVEFSGGHRADHVEPTTLCTECTTSRMAVLMCGTHQMTSIPDTKYTSQDEEMALNDLLDGKLESVDIGAFCSICPSLATLQCSARQEDGPNGCGLKLCDRCTAALVGGYDGNLGKMMAREMAADVDGEGFGFRADADFLRPDGVLVRYLKQLNM